MSMIFTRERAEKTCAAYEKQGYRVERLMWTVVTSKRQVAGYTINVAPYARIRKNGRLIMTITHEWIDERTQIW